MKSLAEIYFTALKGIGKTKKIFNAILILSISMLTFNLILIPTFGIIGAALATFISYLIVMLYTLSVLRRSVAIKMTSPDISKIFIF